MGSHTGDTRISLSTLSGFCAAKVAVVVVPQDQPTRISLEDWYSLRMKSTAAAMSRTASAVRANGAFASGGFDIAGGRVEPP